MKSIVLAITLMWLGNGCVVTHISETPLQVWRVALLYPFEVGDITVTTPSNTVFKLSAYKTDGGSAAVEAAVKGAVEGLK